MVIENFWTPQNGAARVLARCDELAMCSDENGALTRLFLSPSLHQAHHLVADWMRAARLHPRVDEMGNLRGHLAARDENAPLWILGSHLDTVPDAGKYDGALGVLMAIEVVASLGELPFALEVVGFSDEEGVRFKTPYLGSRALAGRFDPNLLELRDEAGVSMRQALENFGLASKSWPEARLKTPIAGYLEAHIEQGPVLEMDGAPLGIVAAIAGQSRLQLRFCGQSGHAGTLPMRGRRDALTGASEWILEVEKTGQNTPDLVATVGFLEVSPNATNVVAGEIVCSLDVRHANDSTRENAVARLVDSAREIANWRGLNMEIVSHSAHQAVAMDAILRRKLRAVVGESAPEMVSGAGHDAAIMAAIAPSAMLFLRTPGGASHCPQEAVWEADIASGLAAMRAFLLELSGD